MSRTRTAVRAGMFIALMAAASRVALPLPFTSVPFTLQVAVLLPAGLLLGPGPGFWSMLGYLLLGALGLPVFAGGTGGLAHLVGYTAGYLWAFPLVAWVVGRLSPRPGPRVAFLRALWPMLVGLGVLYAGGVLGLMGIARMSLGAAVLAGVVPFLPWDVVKALLAAAVVVRLWPMLSQSSDPQAAS